MKETCRAKSRGSATARRHVTAHNYIRAMLCAALLILALVSLATLTGCTSGSDAANYSCQVTLTGGSGRASVESPAEVTEQDGALAVQLIWSSANYDYMMVDGTKYENEAAAGDNSTFTIPFTAYDEPLTVTADTTAMSQPHEIEYQITVSSPDESDSNEPKANSSNTNTSDSASESTARGDIEEAPEIRGLTYQSKEKLTAAKEYTIDYYEADGKTYTLLIIGAKDQFLLIPEGGSVPKSLSKDITPLQLPLTNTYVVSSSVMDPIRRIDALDAVGYTGTKSSDWSIAQIAKLVKSGTIQYAGKYSAPDYEMLRQGGCSLAIENTMIYHTPAVKEKLEDLGIPVMVERSSYESTPLGRLEWVKLYGTLYGKKSEADAFFKKQAKRIRKVENAADEIAQKDRETVAVFAINASGGVTVRASSDYLAKMINLSGGKYLAAKTESDDSVKSTITIQMEDFYRIARDADVLIYNSTIEGDVSSLRDLQKKSSLLKNFKAVKSGEVYCLGAGFFQNSTQLADVMEEMNAIFTRENKKLTVLKKLK